MALKIAVTGEMRSGKNLVSKMIIDLNDNRKIEEIRFAEGIENVIWSYFPEAIGEGRKPRKHYQIIGQSFRKLNPNIWIEWLENEYHVNVLIGRVNMIVTDLRQPNEEKWLRDNGFTIIKVETDKEIRIERIKAEGDISDLLDMEHETEINIRNLGYDYLLKNNGTITELENQVMEVLLDINNKGG